MFWWVAWGSIHDELFCDELLVRHCGMFDIVETRFSRESHLAPRKVRCSRPKVWRLEEAAFRDPHGAEPTGGLAPPRATTCQHHLYDFLYLPGRGFVIRLDLFFWICEISCSHIKP